MKYYLIITLLALSLLYRIYKYSTFFKERISYFQIKNLTIKIDNGLFMFIFFSAVIFYSVNLFDELIMLLFTLIIFSFFNIKKSK